MLSKAAPDQPELYPTDKAEVSEPLLTRKIWLPRLVYDCLPYFYLTAGFAAFFATLYISEWFWILPHYLLFSAACVHLAIAVYRRRHRPSRRPHTEQREPDSSTT